ncbi:MAG: hypothetical protein AAGI50_13920 [Pseudomonadota bacterium]
MKGVAIATVLGSLPLSALAEACYAPSRPLCLAGSGGFRSPTEASLCASATLNYAQLLNLLAACDPSLAGEAIERATKATAKLRCKERGRRPC